MLACLSTTVVAAVDAPAAQVIVRPCAAASGGWAIHLRARKFVWPENHRKIVNH
jgi:hypothetical protein